ncbi:hypothetical protein J6590_063720 [Homalodisca vitripennis]|nr:hypothetical protein J6590_063720 [Homalodisca vitripennis]
MYHARRVIKDKHRMSRRSIVGYSMSSPPVKAEDLRRSLVGRYCPVYEAVKLMMVEIAVGNRNECFNDRRHYRVFSARERLVVSGMA